MSGSADLKTRFYTVTDAGFFPGTVGLLNSLRIKGHLEEMVVLDCGLSPDQRALLGSHCRLFEVDNEVPHPAWLKPYPHLTGDQGIVVIIDGDVIITDSLEPVLRDAAQGKICAVVDSSSDRWFAEWQELFGLSSVPRRQTYMGAGFLAWSTRRWPDLLPRWWECSQGYQSREFVRGRMNDHPTRLCEQDALNALLMTEIPESALRLLPLEQAPFGPMVEAVKVLDAETLSCSRHGERTLLLHNSGGSQPWDRQLTRALRKWRPAYAQLLRRALSGPDLAVRIPQDQLPPWLRAGPVGATLERTIGTVVDSMAGVRRRRARMLRRGRALPRKDPV